MDAARKDLVTIFTGRYSLLLRRQLLMWVEDEDFVNYFKVFFI